MNFEDCIKIVLKHEGGYVDDPNDRGGETNYGITVAVARNYGYKDDMKDLPLQTAKDIYKANYWNKVKANDLPEEVRYIVFDTAINMGVTRASKFLQEAAGVEQDGIIGSQTIAASQMVTKEKYALIRMYFYCQIVRRDKSQAKFIGGWSNRVMDVVNV